MLSLGQIKTIEGLLAQGTPQRQIHAFTGFSRTVISGIAHGRRPDYEAIRRAKAEQSGATPEFPAARCPRCGHQVYQPCRICAARQRQLIEALCPGPSPITELLEPLGLDLLPEHQKRYLQIRARRRLLPGCHDQKAATRDSQRQLPTTSEDRREDD